MALSHCGDFYNTVTYHIEPGHIRLLYSDDNGRSWDFLPLDIFLCYSEGLGLTEPGVIEFDDGTLWVYFRTPYGYQYQAFSHDGGNTFTGVEPNLYFTSPDSPMLVRQISRGTLAVFNPQGFNCMVDRLESWGSAKRTPFVLALSHDDGRSFSTAVRTPDRTAMWKFCENLYYIEDDRKESYCYPAIIGVKDGLLVSYYHSNGSVVCLNSMKIVKIGFDELS